MYDTDYEKFLEVDSKYDMLLEKIENHPEEYSDKFFYLSNEDLKPYIFEEYYSIKNKTKVTSFINNTTFVNEKLYNEMKKYCYYDEENNQIFFTHKTTKANELLKKCINPELTGFSELFPILDNEIIEITWL